MSRAGSADAYNHGLGQGGGAMTPFGGTATWSLHGSLDHSLGEGQAAFGSAGFQAFSVRSLNLPTNPRHASDSSAAQPAGVVRSIFSTLVDSTPKYEFQGLAWAWSLLQAGVSPERIVVHHTPSPSRSFRSALADLGVATREVPAHPSGHPHCNKVQQLQHGAWSGSELIALCDADLIWLDPHGLPRVQFAAKVVDRPNPPEDRWRKLLQDAGFTSVLVPVDVTNSPHERTASTNFNGGLYLLDVKLARELGEAWDERIGWLGSREALLEGFAVHRDQVALALALLDLAIFPVHLDRGWNFPTHLGARLLSRPIVHIRALHHHDRRDETGKLLPVGVDWIDEAVAQANEVLDSMLRTFAAHPLFWDWRYRENPALGSGVGSRGDIARMKRNALAAAVAAHPEWSVVDVGCGDLEISGCLPVTDYLGLDTSVQALKIAATQRPDWRFAHPADIADEEIRADIAICLDVLIHQDDEAADATIQWLIEHATRRIVVSGFDEPPSPVSTVRFHRPLREMLVERLGPMPLFPLARYRGLTMYAVDLNDARTNPNDIDAEAISAVLPLVEHPHLLLELLDRSRGSFGFFPATVTRCIEYPWFLASLENLSAPASVLDIGAGVSALPLALAARGFDVTTVDSHPSIRDPSDMTDWNEWGFLDYPLIDPRIASVHGSFESASLEPQDAMISVSVIEHAPASARRQIIERAADLLVPPNGLLLLSLDLVPGSSDLWNRSEGVQVEEPQYHGTLIDVMNELNRSGFAIEAADTKTTIPGSRTDIALIRARRAR